MVGYRLGDHHSQTADLVTISKAEYKTDRQERKVGAHSSAEPEPVLTLVGWGEMEWNKGKYKFTQKPVECPATVTVTSSFGGSATAVICEQADDFDPPTPDPVTWSAAPAASGPNSIVMTATTATDPSGVEYFFECTAGGGHSTGWQDSSTFEDTGLQPGTQYSYRVMARDKSLNANETAWSAVASATTEEETADVVTISKAEYKEDRQELKVEAHSSAEPEPVLTLVGWGEMEWRKGKYKFTEKPVECPASVTVTSSFGGSATAVICGHTDDLDPPTPDPATWSAPPTASGPNSIAMTAATATDPNGVEYSFECTAGGGHSSGWQDNPAYEDTGLQPETQYSYQVMARDKSSNANETARSVVASATTDALPLPEVSFISRAVLPAVRVAAARSALEEVLHAIRVGCGRRGHGDR